MNRKQKHLVALDAGSAKTCALAAEVTANGKLRCVGLGRTESKGWRKGLIVNLDAVVASIRKAVEEAEQAIGAPIESAVVGLGASLVKGVNSRGGISLSSRQREVQRDDVRKALEIARAINLAPDTTVVHVIPQEFLLDSQDGIRDPVGMTASRLEANVHLVTASQGAVTNLITAANRAGLEVEDTVLEPLAAAEASLHADERELGVALLDIGSGSTDVAVFHHGALRHSFSIAIGGDHFTNDIAVGLRTPIPDAEKIKQNFGVATPKLAGEHTSIEVPSVGDRPSRLVPQGTLADILEPRAQELVMMVKDELRRVGMDRQIGAGIVLTGGGARLGGFCDVVEDVMDVPARIGLPERIDGLPADVLQQPAFSTVVGLAYFAQRVRQKREAQQQGLASRMKAFFSGK